MKKTKKLKLIALVMLLTTIMLLTTTNVKAVLQANYTTHNDLPIEKTGTEWINEIRQMEASGGTMGLNEKLNDNGSLLDNGTHNNIDVHMMKTTEWGAIEILAASGYGAGNAKAIDKTTTNNSTGVYFKGDLNEWTAGIATVSGTVGSDKDSRYYDNYETTDGDVSNIENPASNGGPKPGDGLGIPNNEDLGYYPGCMGWETATKEGCDTWWFKEENGCMKRRWMGFILD